MTQSQGGITKLESVLIPDPTESPTKDAHRSPVFTLRVLFRPMTARTETHAIFLWAELLV
jgi:hypothetical protein